MEIAIFHDYFDDIGGAEITLLHLARGLNAVIFTTNIDTEKIASLGFADVEIRSIGFVPKIKHVKQLSTILRFLFVRKNKFDFYIFGGSFSIYGAFSHKANLWCCFSPLRGIYDLRYVNSRRNNFLAQWVKEIQIFFDQKAVRNMNRILTPSQNVQERITRYYNRKSTLIYHPVNVTDFYNRKAENFWLIVTRVDPYKRLDLVVEAFKELPSETLVVVGEAAPDSQNYFSKIRSEATENVIFKGAIYDKKQKNDLYATCKGFIVASKNEDLGLNVVEAMASGKPVIAPAQGGYLETILDKKTGILIKDITSKKIADAITSFPKDVSRYKKDCIAQAKKFSVETFVKKTKKAIEESLK